MANQSKLKAWVRYDGTGRVVTAGPIFQANKPKVGNWRQINADLCCNPNGSSTTTTTQGGSTPTAWIAYTANNPYSACQQNGGSSRVLYTSVSTLGTGVTLYEDAALAVPYNSTAYGVSVNIGGTLYALVDNAPPVIAAVLSCDGFTTTSTTTPYVGQYYNGDYNSSVACTGNGAFNLPLTFVPQNACFGGEFTLAVGTWASYGITPGAIVWVNINTGNVVQMYANGTTQGLNFGCTSCGTTTTTTTQAPVLSFIGAVGGSTSAACNAPGGTQTYYTTGPLNNGYPQNGIIVYYDQALTQPVTSAYVGSPGIGQVWECFNGELYNQQSCF